MSGNIQGSQRPIPAGFATNSSYGMTVVTTDTKRWLIYVPLVANTVLGMNGNNEPVAIPFSTLQGQTGAQGDTGNTGQSGVRGSLFLGSYATSANLPSIDGVNVRIGDYAYLTTPGELWTAQ